MALDETTIIIIASLVATIVILACAFILYAIRRRPGKPVAVKPKLNPEFDPVLSPSLVNPQFKVTKSVQSNDAVRAKDELRILDLEREIVADAIRHLYEAQAEGKITELERERLASSYKNRMMSIKDSIAKDEGIVALHELENMQEDLMKLFSERFGELSGKVEELRTRIEVSPIKEIKIPTPKLKTPSVPIQMEEDLDEDQEVKSETEPKDRPKKQKKPPSEKRKTEAEQRIDAIRSQIDEVMDKLGQMEMET